MYEISRFLSATNPKAARKARKPAAKRVTVGTSVRVFCMGNHTGVVVERHPNGAWWNVRIDGMAGLHGFDRKLLEAV